MSVAEIKNKDRVINELMLFIRKVLAEPEISEKAIEIARKHINEPNADMLIADELSSTTNVKIPIEHSDADTLFLQVLKDVVRDETALY
ncbi:hypothetical protein IOQ59_07130 [Pontibacterium sp. N1Y112]|uniref:Uncharacterized protein n=1 Tax=Pontibacterium sinense TaxID=2781979 RepID=A0A8J7FJ16_9GAMM|nr:hypothetical protein [Pontibacterium sinense]MBE9397033.1 hypothetical protein [Pontibacterium sinense]MCO4758595.1 hypothetical protein [Oceanospirillaceae bacterium]|tara:strand:+ start:625 stop:891 length:267 start_codon:yes stop_codon:yes gene_type:complete